MTIHLVPIAVGLLAFSGLGLIVGMILPVDGPDLPKWATVWVLAPLVLVAMLVIVAAMAHVVT